jgi:hypothetical protein
MPSRYSERLSFYDCTRAPRYVVRELENQPLAAGSDSLTVALPSSLAADPRHAYAAGPWAFQPDFSRNAREL